MPDMSMEFAALARAVSELRSTADGLDHQRTTLHASFASFLGDGWRGQAAESFRDGWDDWSTGVGSVLDGLQSMATLIEEHGKDVHTHDEGAQSSMAHLDARLGTTGGHY